MSKRLLGWGSLSLILAFCATFQVSVPYANALQSTNYRFDESVVGTSDLEQSSSTNYQASNSTGDLSIGNAASTNYQVNAGSKTTPDPALSFAINNGNVNFGSFTPASATVTTTTFSVSNYTSFGYVAQIFGNPPSNGSHTISAMTTTGASQAGIEQFGINLVANTSPVSVGANPDNGQFGFGTVATNYGTSNVYRYVSGETIASAPKSSGITTYTISYLINVSSLTLGGQYTSNQTIIIIGTY
jgi:hypothetical protein